MAKPSRQIHQVAPKDSFDRAAFVFAFIIGIGGSIVLKLLHAHPFVVAGFSAFILVFYAILAWMSGRVRLEPETIGDNCYYLGFLFTLASLSFTLYQIAAPETSGGRPADIPEVISGFGVALSSTIVGVFLRVMLMQLRPDFVVKEREVRADINSAFSDFKKQMSAILAQMKAFSTESVQLASERDTRLIQSTEEVLKAQRAEIENSSKQFNDGLQKSLVASVEGTLSGLNAIFEDFGKQSQESIVQFQEQMKAKLAVVVDEEDKTIQALREQRLSVNKAFEEFGASSTRSMGQVRDKIESNLAVIVDEETEAIRLLREQRLSLEQELKAQKSLFERHAKSISKLDESVQVVAQTLSKSVGPALEEYVARLRQLPLERIMDSTSLDIGARGGTDKEKRWWQIYRRRQR